MGFLEVWKVLYICSSMGQFFKTVSLKSLFTPTFMILNFSCVSLASEVCKWFAYGFVAEMADGRAKMKWIY